MAADFKEGSWTKNIDVRDFIQKNYTPYTGDAAFLAAPTERTMRLRKKLDALLALERERGGVLDVETQTVSSLLNYAPGYLDKEDELIVGLQTDAPLRRGVNPFGGIKMAREACAAYGYTSFNTEPPTTMAYTGYIQKKCEMSDDAVLLLACLTLTAGAESSGTTEEWRCTA